MGNTYEPTTEELKAQWKRTGLWRLGHRFEDDLQIPVIVRVLRIGVIARHRTQSLPEQCSLI